MNASLCIAMSTPVSPLANALRLLKVELARARDARPENRLAADVNKPATQVVAGQAAAATALKSLPGKLKAARTQNGGLSRGKALRLFLEAVLLDEFGSNLQLDPAFGDLVERTCRSIEQDEESATLLTDALRELEALVD